MYGLINLDSETVHVKHGNESVKHFEIITLRSSLDLTPPLLSVHVTIGFSSMVTLLLALHSGCLVVFT